MMKPQMTKGKKVNLSHASNFAGGSEISLSFQDELVATIQGAFEVAVEITVLEVSKLVSQALGDVRDQMHEALLENESLKQRLQSTEERLEAVRTCMGEGGGRLSKQLSTSSQTANQPPTPISPPNRKTQKHDLKGDSCITVDVDLTQEISDYQSGSFREICEDGQVFSQELQPDSAESSTTKDLYKESDEGTSSLEDSGEDLAFGPSESSLPPDMLESSKVEEVRVKEEKKEKEPATDCPFGSVSEEAFDPDSLSVVQSKMLEEWKPDLLDIMDHNADCGIPGTSFGLHNSSNVNPDAPELRAAPSASGLPVFSTEFPHLFQPGEAERMPTLPQVYGVQVKTNRNPSNPSDGVHQCKICSLVFHQPSELRRHYSQCQQTLQQHSKTPLGSKRTKLQLYPPGCSPYHCTECGRDFNRLENLKTHLRIHSGERPYTCSFCAKRFRHSGALTRHLRIHTGEKPYICSQCGKTFRNCGGLRYHQRSHTS